MSDKSDKSEERKNLTFRHESIEDGESIADLLKALTKAFAKQRLTLGDGEREIHMEPEGLLHLRVSATKEGMSNRLSLRVSWRSEESQPEQKKLKVL